MANNELHHIGIAVRSIAAARPFYEQHFGAKFVCEETVPAQQVRVAFLQIGNVLFELLEPTDSAGKVARFLEKRGEGLHHLAFRCGDLAARIEELKAAGLQMVDDSPRPGSLNMQIAFAHPHSAFGVLTEFCQEE